MVFIAWFLLTRKAESEPLINLDQDENQVTVVNQCVAPLSLPDIPDKPVIHKRNHIARVVKKVFPQAMKDLSDKYATKHGVDPEYMWRIVYCESGGRADAKNPTSSATGVVQILLSAHPDITRDQALDPDFSLDWMANHLSQGHDGMWVCKG